MSRPPPYANWHLVRSPIPSLDTLMTELATSPWRGPRVIWARRIGQLLIGLFLYGIAIAMMVRAGIGVAPWDVLTQGIVKQTGITFGMVTIIVGAIVLLLWIPIRQKPGVGTVLNILLIGPAADIGLALIPQQHEP